MVDSRLINAKFVNYNDRAPPPSRLPDITHVTLSPFPSVFILRDQNWSRERPGNEAMELQRRVLAGPYGGPVVHSDVASVAETQLFRILSALCPHYSRSLSAPFPQHLRNLSAIFPHCSRGISALLLLRSLSAPFPQHLRSLSALFPRCLRTVAAVLPQSSFSQELQYSYTAERFSCLGRFI